MRNVCVTGLGMVTPLGPNAEQSWQRLVDGNARVGEGADAHGYRTLHAQLAGTPSLTSSQRRDRSVDLAIVAANEAVGNASLRHKELADAAVVIGSSKGCVLELLDAHKRWLNGDPCPPGLLGRVDPAEPARALARYFGLLGPRIGVAAACATGLHAVIRAAQMVTDGQADVVLTGATDASIHLLFLAALDRMGVLAGVNGDPAKACRPFDRHRGGFVLAEGAAMLVLEAEEHALQRHARVLAILKGWAIGADPTGMVDLDMDGLPVAAVIRRALASADLGPEQLDYIHAHGTGTRVNDVAETRAIKAALGPTAHHVPVSSAKGALGHMMGAAGAVAAALCVVTTQRQLIPPTANLTEPDPDCDLDYTPLQARNHPVRHAITLSMGFGGQIGALIVSRPTRTA